MSNLFISHSSADNDAAREVEAWLAEQEHESVFLDLDPEKGIQTGESWERTLYRKLRACRAVIALVSDRYLASQWCFAEVALARMEGKELFVLKIDPWSDESAMPSILTEEQFIDFRSDKEDGYRRLLNGFKVKGIVPERHRQWGPDEPPYPGLRAFQEEDAPIFFGRDKEVREGLELLNRVCRQGQPRLVMVLGASGSGKSSLTRAGILPRLRKDSARWRLVGPLRPGSNPARELAAALARAFKQAGEPRSWEEILDSLDPAASAAAAAAPGPEPDSITDSEARQRLLMALAAAEADLAAADRTVVDSVRRLKAYLGAPPPASAEAAGPPEPPRPAGRNPLGELTTRLRLAEKEEEEEGPSEATVVLVIDQFEELLGHEDKGPGDPRNRFLGLLREALRAEDDPPLVLGTMRSDFLGMLQRSLPFQEVDFQSLSVGPMPRQGMHDVITRPADLGGLKLDDGLADLLLTETETSDALPLLAFTLRAMWDLHHEEGRLTIGHYEALGGIQGAIARVAEETLQQALGRGDERTLRAAFLGLARQTAEGSGWTRRAKSWDELEPAAHPMLECFVDNRLLVKRDDGSVEVAHEALFRSWETLRGWLDANAEAFRLLGDIQAAAERWQDAPSAEAQRDYFLRGGRLARARELRDAGVLELEPRDETFIEESHRAEQAERQRKLRRTQITLAVVGAAFVVAVVFAWLAWQQSIRARDQAMVAVAADWMDRDPTRAALVLLELRKPDDAPRAVSLMAEATTRRLARVELAGHAGPLRSAVFGWRGEELMVLTASRDQTVRIWSATGAGDPAVLEQTDEVLSAAFHPDGDRVVASLLDGKSLLWTPEALAGEAEPVALEQGGEIHTAVFSDDGERLVTASDNGTVRLWTAEGRPVRLAGEALMLDLEAGENRQASSAVFAPDGRRVLISTNDGGVHLWSAEEGELVTFEQRHDKDTPARRASFDPSGERFVTVSFDGTARLWNVDGSPVLDSGGQPVVLRHAAPVYDAVFDREGERVLTASDDGTARLWQTDGSPALGADNRPVVLRHANGVASVRMSPDGSTILTACKDGTARLWDVEFGGEPVLLRNQRDQQWVNSAAFGPGELVVTVSDDGKARLWDAANGQPVPGAAGARTQPAAAGERTVWSSGSSITWPLDLTQGHSAGQALRTFVSPSGDRFLTASEDGTARLWSADGEPLRDAGNRPIVLRHEAKINRAAFGRDDGELIVTASDDGTARVWHSDGRRPELVLDHGGVRVNSAAFDPAGRRVVTAAQDKKARVWSIDPSPPAGAGDLEPDLALEEKGEVYDAAFDPDGRRIATAWGLRASIWPAGGGEPLASFEGHEDKVLSVAFDPAGRRIVTTSDDKTARIWNTGGDADPVVLRGHEDFVEKAVFSPDGDRLVSVSWDSDARLWRTTYAGLGAAIRDAAPGVCLPPAFRERALGEASEKARARFEECRACLAAPGLAGFRECFLPVFP